MMPHRPRSVGSLTLTSLLLLLGTTDARLQPRNDLEDLGPLPVHSLVGGGVTLRILALGDALTYGSPASPNAYREALRDLLLADGNPVDMVGSAAAGTMDDNQVEAGAEGDRTDELLERARAAVPAFLPNLVLINAGAEDCRQGYETGGAAERIMEIMEYSWAESVTSSVVLSTTLAPGGDEAASACVEDVNQQIRELVGAQQARSRKVVLVDFDAEGGITPGDVDDDGFPSAEAYEKMAGMWFDGIGDAASRGWLETPEPLPENLPDAGGVWEPEPPESGAASPASEPEQTESGEAASAPSASGSLSALAPGDGDVDTPSAGGEVAEGARDAEGRTSKAAGSCMALVAALAVGVATGM